MRTATIENLEHKIANAEAFIARAAKKAEKLAGWKAQLAEQTDPARVENLDTEEARLLARLERIRREKDALAEKAAAEAAGAETVTVTAADVGTVEV